MMAGSDDTNRIERDLEHTRARLDATIGALQQKLSPGQMVDEGMNWFKEGGGAEFGRNLGRSVRDHPMPVALIGVGVAWLMMSSARDRSSSSGRDWRERDWDQYGYGDMGRGYAEPASSGYATSGYGTTTEHQPLPYEAAAYDDLATKAYDAGSRVERRHDDTDESYQERVHTAKGTILGVSRQVGETVSAFGERVEAAVSAAADRFRRMGQRASGAASDASGRAGSMAGDMASRSKAGLRSLYGYGQSTAYGMRDSAGYAAYRARDMGSRTADYLQDQPLLMGVLGLTVGAVLGMLVPATRYERERLGEVRESLRDRAREAVGEVGQRAMRVAETVLDTAHEATRREGLTSMSPSGVAAGARQQVADAAGRVRTVVEETATAGREALERELSGSGDTTSGGTQSTTAGRQSGEYDDRRPVA